MAVETGASPEVVNLLVVAHWRGIVATDNSGRTPILDDNANIVLEEDDARVVQESLQRCVASYQEYQQEWEQQLQGRQDVYVAELQKLQEKHQQELQQERDKQASLVQELRLAQQDCVAIAQERDAALGKVQQEQRVVSLLRQDVLDQQTKVTSTRKQVAACEATVAQLHKLLKEKDGQQQTLRNRLVVLQEDLQNVYRMQQTQGMEALRVAQQDLAQVWESQQALRGKLSGQSQGLQVLLQRRGIPVPTVEQTTATTTTGGVDEKKEDGGTQYQAPTTQAEVLAKTALAAKEALEAKQDETDTDGDNEKEDKNKRDVPHSRSGTSKNRNEEDTYHDDDDDDLDDEDDLEDDLLDDDSDDDDDYSGTEYASDAYTDASEGALSSKQPVLD